MINDLDEWKKKVAKAREHFYCLNYYTTQQLLLLRKELSLYIDPNYNHNLRPDVLSLLQCLSREITQEQVISHIRDTDDLDEDEEITPSNLVSQHMEEISTIEEDNGMTAVTPVTTRHSPTSAAQPKLGENDLTIKQRMIFDNLIMSYGFHSKLILLAFERSAEPEIEEEVEIWCSQHQDEFEFIDEGETKEGFWPLEEEWDNQEIGDNDGRPIEGKVAVNEDHPIVQQLLLAGYSLEQAFTALDQNPSNTQEAMEFIDQLEETNQRGEVEDEYWYFDEKYTGPLDVHTG